MSTGRARLLGLTGDGDSDEGPGASAGAAGGDDVVVLGSELPDGKGVGVVRLREGNVELGRVQPMEEGKPILGEVVKLTPRSDSPRVCDVEVQYTPKHVRKRASAAPAPATAASRSGPPQVATDDYRRNWDAIWAQKKTLPS